MNKCKIVLARTLSVILIVALVSTFSMLDVAKVIGAIEVQAAPALSADEAMKEIENLKGNYLDYDGVEGAQCVDLVKYYYNLLGVSWVRGDAITYKTDSSKVPSGWRRIQGATPEKGDILIYTGGTYGHVGIYKSGGVSYHQNVSPYRYITTYNYNSFRSYTYWGVIRPDFIKLNETYVTLNRYRSQFQLRATVAEGEKGVTWKSSDTSVVKVREDGLLIPMATSGTVKITATTISGNTAECTVVVKLYK